MCARLSLAASAGLISLLVVSACGGSGDGGGGQNFATTRQVLLAAGNAVCSRVAECGNIGRGEVDECVDQFVADACADLFYSCNDSPRALNADIEACVRALSSLEAPSNELRRWYQHDHSKWDDFRRRYFAELDANPAGLAELREHLGSGTVTLLFGSKEEKLNNATALREYLGSSRKG